MLTTKKESNSHTSTSTLCLDHYTIAIIAERYYVFFSDWSFFLRSGKNLDVLTSQAVIDLNYLAGQYSIFTTTPPWLLPRDCIFFLTNPLLPLWKEPKRANQTTKDRLPTLRLATLRLDLYTVVTGAESSTFFLLTLFFRYRKNLKVLTTQEGIEAQHFD